ncbi:MAG: NAD(P)/FAD-dependent oxidoreductase, partial [Myxococcales bacterium]|nr:NAD(P)/FAD-dependent oxidoreductase [Myxococcales bacterium]
IVGAGPAGIAAAVTAAEAGAKVLLIDEGAAPGGQIWRAGVDDQARPPAARAWLDRAARQSQALAHRSGEAVVDATILQAGERIRLTLHREGEAQSTRVDVRALILACGARERFLPFPGWTLPGVVGIGALQALCKQGFDPAGKRVVLAGTGPLMLAVTADLRERGAEVAMIAEQAPRRAIMSLAPALLSPKLGQALSLGRRLATVPRRWSSWPVQAHGSSRIEAVTLTDADDHSTRIDCDILAAGFGLVPETRLARLLGCAVDPDGAVQVDGAQRSSIPSIFAVGEQCGIAGVDAALIEGRIAATTILGQSPAPSLLRARDRARHRATRQNHAFALRPDLRAMTRDDTVVCRCEGAVLADIAAWPDARAARLHSRCGMGPCQGRVCEPALEFLLSWQPGRCRPPLRPLPLSALSESP